MVEARGHQGLTQVEMKLHPNPEVSANFLSRITFVYIIPFMLRGFKRQLEEDDMYEPIPNHQAKIATEAITRTWENEIARAKKTGTKQSLFRAVMRSYVYRAFCFGILLFLEEVVRLTQPMMIGRLISYFSFGTSLTLYDAYIAAAAVAIAGTICPLLHHPYFYGVQKLGMELKIATCGIIMQKALHLSCGALHRTTIGHIVTVMSNDVARFDFLFLFLNYVWIGPFLLFAYIYMLWYEIGPSCIAGFLTLILFFPVQSFFSRQMGRCRKLIAFQTDKRLSVMDEILNGIRVVKMYAWEDAFASIIEDLRKKELVYVKENTIWQSLVLGTFWASTKFIALSVILTYLFSGNEINAERVFVTTALFNSCRHPLALFLPFALQHLFESRVSFNRIQAFLELEEFKEFKNPVFYGHLNGSMEKTKNVAIMKLDKTYCSQERIDCNKAYSEGFVKVEALATTWDEKNGTEEPLAVVRNVSFTARPGDLIAIIGPVGAGKSSLLFSLLRETRLLSGKLEMHGNIAYVPQEPWLFCGTVRENILFGKPYDKDKYCETIRVCCLRKDLSQLPHGDLSAVGDQGHSLSGGQKARISLARAVYSNADIYLLDDPLSAVDPAVGRYLFKICITGFLKTKVTILVTHQVQFLNSAKLVILMQDAHMIGSGTMEQLKQLSSFSDVIQETEKSYSRQASECEGNPPPKPFDIPEVFDGIAEEGDEDEIFVLAPEEKSPLVVEKPRLNSQDEIKNTSQKTPEHRYHRFSSRSPSVLSDISESSLNIRLKQLGDGELKEGVEEEDRAAGSVSWRIYFLYLKAMANPSCILIIAFGFAMGVQIFNNTIDWWLNKWSTASEKAISADNQLARARSDNASSAWNSTLQSFVDTINFKFFEMKFSLVEYRNVFTAMVLIFMIVSVLRCVWFRLAQVNGARLLHNQMFDTIVKTPITFFDQNPIGRILNRFSKDIGTMDDQLSYVFFEFFAGMLHLSATVLVILILNPFIIIPFLPLCLIFWFLRQFYLASSRDIKRLEATTRSPLYSHISSIMHGLPIVRSFKNESLAMDKFCFYQDRNSAALFLHLITSRWFASVIDWLVALFIAIVAFSCIITKASPESGEVALMLVYVVQFTGFFSWIMRQSAELQNGMVSIERIVNYTELPTENLSEGILPPAKWPQSGGILFKNVSLQYQKDGPYTLKNLNFEILPKEKVGIVGRTGAGKSSLLSVLFRLVQPEGTIIIDGLDTKKVLLKELRKRLSIIPQDPVLFIGRLRRNLDPFDDYTDEQLWNALEQVELKAFVSNLPESLETRVEEGGANFSVGQRQLICLARAILKHAKVLVIDEATANVDPETDTFIQHAIKANFASSTVLTVAHRLHTIMDSDKVMVLDNGCLVEFDHPYILLNNEFGIFNALVGETGEENSVLLKQAALNSYNSKL